MKRLLLVFAAAAAALPFAYQTARGGSAASGESTATRTVCHKTTSTRAPYRKIQVNAAQLRAHGRHAADIIPAPRGACPRTILTPTRNGVLISAALAGETENPAGDPVATGSATIRLRLGQGQVCATIDAPNLATRAAAAHIHQAAAGAVGGVVVPLKTPDENGKSSGCVAAARTVVKQILASRAQYYVNVHTAEFPGGAVRGQLGSSDATLGRTFTVTMAGRNEAPAAGDPDGAGTAVIRIRRSDAQLCYRITVSNVQLPAVGAHIHRGAAGGSGPIVIPFTAPAENGVTSACTAVDGALLDEILANPANFYVNVHSREFPGGAVRAPLA